MISCLLYSYTGWSRPPVSCRCIATGRSLIEIQNQLHPLNISPTKIWENYFQLCETPQNCTIDGVEVGFGRFSYVKVGRAIPYSKGTPTILVKWVFNYCHLYVQGSQKCIGTSKTIALHPYPTSEDYQISFQSCLLHMLQENVGYGHNPPILLLMLNVYQKPQM